METLKTIRLQLSAVEEAYRGRQLREAVDGVLSIHDLLDVLASSFLTKQARAVKSQVDRLSEIGLVASDLDAQLEAASKALPREAAALIETVQARVLEMLNPDGKLLLRTNIFARGKKTFLPFKPEDTIDDVAKLLKERYRAQIVSYLTDRGDSIANPEAVDIIFFNSLVWERPDEAVLPGHTLIVDVVERETEGLLWFPVLPGDTPALFGIDDDDIDDEAQMSILENFTIEADIAELEGHMRRVAERIHSDSDSQELGWRSRAYLLRGVGTAREERIPLVGERVTIGRGRENDIQILNDHRVSRFHCRLLCEEDEFYIEDNSSSNGTLVNGERVTRIRLAGGEMLGIGETAFRFFKD